MKEATYFQAKGNSYFITKKHIAIIFFIWWLFINLYVYFLTPFSSYIYKSISEFGDQPILQEDILNQKTNNIDIAITESNDSIKKVKQKKDKDLLKNKQIQFQSKQITDTSRDQIKMTFKIKGKRSDMQKMKKQIAQQTLKLAMQTYLEQKNSIKNYQEEF